MGNLLLDETRRSTITTTTTTLGVKRWHSLVGWLVGWLKRGPNLSLGPPIINYKLAPKVWWHIWCTNVKIWWIWHTLGILHWNGWNHKCLLTSHMCHEP
jgi:hypothetical protein